MKIELTDIEIAVLKVLHLLNYEYIARDKSKRLYAYFNIPGKHGDYWDSPNYWEDIELNYVVDYFDFIQWTDKKPYKIEELLK